MRSAFGAVLSLGIMLGISPARAGEVLCRNLVNPPASNLTESRALVPVGAAPLFRTRTSPRLKSGFMKVAPTRSLYYRYFAPTVGKPTVVMINGLTHNYHNWDAFAARFEQGGYGVLRYDPWGHGETLKNSGMPTDPIPYKDQVEDLKSLLDSLQILDPVTMVGLSYGGAIDVAFAKEYPNRVAHIVPQSMYLGPLKNQDEWIRMQIDIHIAQADWVKMMFPWVGDRYNPRDPKIYDAMYDYFMKQVIYYVYPTVEPEILSQSFKPEATFRLVQGIRKFSPTDIAPQIQGKVHMMVALQDQYIDQKDFATFWSRLSPQAKSSMLIIDGSKHSIITDVYDYASAWVKLIMDGDSRIDGGKVFQGSARQANAVNGSETIDLSGVW